MVKLQVANSFNNCCKPNHKGMSNKLTAMPTTHELTNGFFNTDSNIVPNRNCSLGSKATIDSTLTNGMHTAKITASICAPLPAAKADTIAKPI